MFLSQLHPRALLAGAIATALLGLLIVVGSRNLADFDAALIGYCFATLFATFGLAYRYAVWLTKPPTWKCWVRGWQLCFSPRLWKNLRSPRILAEAVLRRIVVQDFVWRRSPERWAGHMLIAAGCVIAAAITFPLVSGWVHFEHGSTGPEPTFVVWVSGFPVREIVLGGIEAFAVFHGLILASFLVIPGVMLVMYRRMREPGAVAVQRFGRDFLPLVLLFAVAFSGLLLWVSYEFLEGYFYTALGQFHAWTVIATLLYLPFGKLFHVFQRPASLGISYYKAAGAEEEPAHCPVTGEGFASAMQTQDLKEVLGELGFDYGATGAGAPAWNEVSPKGRRMLIGRWEPENAAFWSETGSRVAWRNLYCSMPALFLAFAVWMVWSTVVVKLRSVGFAFSDTQLFWLAALPGLSGDTPASLDALEPDHGQIAFRKKHLSGYLVKLVTAPYDGKMLQYLDWVGRIHTPKAGNPEIAIPIVQIGALSGFANDALIATIQGLDIPQEKRTAMIRAFTKLLWIQADLFNRHYVEKD
jgi:nitrate reductase gamma subunit